MNWVVSCTLCGSSYVYGSGQGLPDMCPICSEKKKKEVNPVRNSSGALFLTG